MVRALAARTWKVKTNQKAKTKKSPAASAGNPAVTMRAQAVEVAVAVAPQGQEMKLQRPSQTNHL